MRRIVLVSTLVALGALLTGCVGDSGGFGQALDPGAFAGYYTGTIPGGTMDMEFTQLANNNNLRQQVGTMHPDEPVSGGAEGVFAIRKNGQVVAVGELISSEVDFGSQEVQMSGNNEGFSGGGFDIVLKIRRNDKGQITGFDRTVNPDGQQNPLVPPGEIHLDRKDEDTPAPGFVTGTYSGTVTGSGITNPDINVLVNSAEWYNAFSGGVSCQFIDTNVFAAFIGGKVYVIPTDNFGGGIKPAIESWDGVFQGSISVNSDEEPVIDGTFHRISGSAPPESGSFHIVRNPI